MATFSTLLAFIVVGVAAWFGAESYERRKNATQVRALQAKLHFTESRALEFRNQFEQLQKDVGGLREGLAHAHEARSLALMGFHQSFRKGVLTSGAACLVFGLVFGGTVSGFWSTVSTQTKNRQQIIDLQVIARVAEMNAKIFKDEVDKFKKDFEVLRKSLDEERIAKSIAMTKLEIVLENLVGEKWGHGFSLDPKKLKRAWDQSNDLGSVSDQARLMSPPVAAL